MSVALAIAIAFLSRRYFEEPFLRLKDRLAPTGHSLFRRRKMDAAAHHALTLIGVISPLRSLSFSSGP